MNSHPDLNAVQRMLLLDRRNSRLSYDQLGRNLDIHFMDRFSSDMNRAESALPVDSPISKEGDDAFGFSDLALDLADQLTSPTTQTPFSTCIDGAWGTGKSSLARLAYSAVDGGFTYRHACLPVWIDTSFVLRSGEVASYVAERTLTRGLEIARRILEIDDELLLDEAPLKPFTFSSDRMGAADLRAEAQLVSKLRSNVAAWYKKWNNHSVTWNNQTFRIMVREMRYGLLGGGGLARVAWFVDDLDRCNAGIVVEFMRLHRSLLEEWGTALVYAMDYRIVAAIIRRHFQMQLGRNVYGRDEYAEVSSVQEQMYLEKFFVARLRPPEPTETNLRSWLKQVLGRAYFDNLEVFLRLAHISNARSIKRFVHNVSQLRNRFLNATPRPGSNWEVLQSAGDHDVVLKLLTKIAAIALTNHLQPFYDYARYPDARRLVELENAARLRREVRCTFYTTQGFQDVSVNIPEDLEILLKNGPSFTDASIPVLLAIISLIEHILPAPFIRSRSQIITPNLVRDDAKGVTPTAPPVSQSEIQAVRNVVIKWIDALQNVGIRLPEKLAQILSLAPSDDVIRAFSSDNDNHNLQTLIGAGMAYLANGDTKSATWVWCAAAIHPDWALSDMETVVSASDPLGDLEFDPMIYTITGARYPNEVRVKVLLARTLIRTDPPEKVAQGLGICLQVLGVTQEDFRLHRGALQDQFGNLLYRDAFLGATDGFGKLGRHEEELHLCELAIQTRSGATHSSVLRNLARALDRSKRSNEAMQVYYAAVTSSATDPMACTWLARVVEEQAIRSGSVLTNPTLITMAGLDRDATDADVWALVGIRTHNDSRAADATRWMVKAVHLEPKNMTYREILAQNIALIQSRRDAARILDVDYLPPLDTSDEELVAQQAAAAHLSLFQEIISLGKIEYRGQVLFDATQLPQWIQEKLGG